MNKKVILFVVEGLSDKEVLDPIISELLDQTKIYFEVIRGDLTVTDKVEFKYKNMKQRVTAIVKNFLQRNRGIAKKHIEKIVYITDTDGCYVGEDHICYSEQDEHFRYEEDNIFSNDVNSVIKRNKEKSMNLNIINSASKVFDVPIEVYYFSCNLDHVLFDERNLDESLKEPVSIRFAASYEENEIEFINFINDKRVMDTKEYRASWEYVKEATNSLSQCTNFFVFFLLNYEYLNDQAKNRLDELNT